MCGRIKCYDPRLLFGAKSFWELSYQSVPYRFSRRSDEAKNHYYVYSRFAIYGSIFIVVRIISVLCWELIPGRFNNLRLIRLRCRFLLC